MTSVRAGDTVIVSTLDSTTTREYTITIIVGDTAYISADDNPEERSAIVMDVRNGQWKVQGAETEFNVDIESPTSHGAASGEVSQGVIYEPFDRSEIVILSVIYDESFEVEPINVAFPDTNSAITYLITAMREVKRLIDANIPINSDKLHEYLYQLIEDADGDWEFPRDPVQFEEFIEHLQTIPIIELRNHIRDSISYIQINNAPMFNPRTIIKSAGKR